MVKRSWLWAATIAPLLSLTDFSSGCASTITPAHSLKHSGRFLMAKNLQPWYRVVNPREDLREGKPLDASEFAVHLDQVRDGRAPTDYQKPERFFERTYLTRNLTALSAEVLRRLSGVQTETSAVFNMTTQFGGGKTHFLTLLYHLARKGPGADRWVGVQSILDRAGVRTVPPAATA